jgi:ribosomal protein S18 acetylase RimI-like enzyme
MPVEFFVIDNPGALRDLREGWRSLAERDTGSLFRNPEWLLPWWDAFHHTVGAELRVYVGRDEGKLVCIAPFYRRRARLGPGLRATEIRLLGDAGPRPPALDLLVERGYEEQAGTQLAQELHDAADTWDVIDLEPLKEPSRVRAYLASRLSALGHHVESHETGGAWRLALLAGESDLTTDIQPDPQVQLYAKEEGALRDGLASLRRLSRLEWGDREELSPLADPASTHLLEGVTLSLGKVDRARFYRLDDEHGAAIAIALTMRDGDRSVVLAMAVDPLHTKGGAVARLVSSIARDAAQRGKIGLDVVIGAGEYPLPALPCTRQRALNVRVFSSSKAAALARTYSAVRRSVDAARDAPGAAARAAWTTITSAAERVTGYQRLHLYRGELWTRGVAPPKGLEIGLFSREMFEELADEERADLVSRLDLDETYIHETWERGDLAVLARMGGRPAGIGWCARGSVRVPELGRTLQLGPASAYIHDVYVGPHARGRNVAPAMLEFLAAELRQRDVYRSWALISHENAASIRAFEKAAYTSVADIIYASKVDRLSVRPPDPEAVRLLGL